MTHGETGIWETDFALSNHTEASELAQAISDILPRDQPVADFGSGVGYYSRTIQANGFDVLAIDGTPDLEKAGIFSPILVKDLSEPLILEERRNVVCLEVGEHIPNEFEAGILDNITRNAKEMVIMSWAIPGQGGTGHVNEQSNHHIIDQMMKRGFRLNRELTDSLRGFTPDHAWWFRDSIMVFDRIKIGLAMLALNEESNIRSALDPVIPFVSSIYIDIGGSTDRTSDLIREITNEIIEANELEIFTGELNSFAENWNKSTKWLKDRGCEWIIRSDADTILEGKLPDLDLETPGFEVPILNPDRSLVSFRPWIFRPDCVYIQGAHEGLIHPEKFERTSDSIQYLHTKLSGARPKIPETYLNDVKLLFNDLGSITNGDPWFEHKQISRGVFYLANSYRDGGDLTKALAFFRMRLHLEGFREEVDVSFKEIARLTDRREDHDRALREAPYRPDIFVQALDSAIRTNDLEWIGSILDHSDPSIFRSETMFCSTTVSEATLKHQEAVASFMNEDGLLEFPQWLMWEEAISDEECDRWIEMCRELETKNATIFREAELIEPESKHRKTQVRWVNNQDQYREIHERLWSFIEQARVRMKVHVDYLPPLQFTEYADVGHHYDTHHDVNFNRQDGRHRKVSIVVNLTDPGEYEGGDFHFLNTESPDAEALKKRGTVICFLSYQDHKVTPIESGSRTSMVGWAEGPRWV